MARLYLGREAAPGADPVAGADFLLDPDRLTQHAVCFGMTGSGKTGLCITLLEELSLAGVPILAIDPKGDLSNLCLAFAGPTGADLAPWVDPTEAERKGLSVQALSEAVAGKWRAGLDAWGVGPERRQALTERVSVTVFTPGSHAGVPVDILGSVGRCPEVTEHDALAELAGGTAAGLLALLGQQSEPTDPPHLLITTVLLEAWQKGLDLDLETLVLAIVDPPFEKVGVFPVDAFFKRKDRLALAMQLNAVLASPALAAWREGAPLDVAALLSPDGDRSPIRVFHLAHLDEGQRLFFTSMLLNRVVAWSRKQPGTSALRALVYFDEVFGYLPPHPKNPPTKQAVLTLMKQARAVGVSTMLVTQNPVDVDYKALSNAAQWFVGRLQTEQDRERVIDGLAAATGQGAREVDQWLRELPSRTFVVRHAKDDAPRRVHSRWAMSYLRGPLTLREIERLDSTWPRGTPSPARGAVSAGSAGTDEALLQRPPSAPTGFSYQFLSPAVAFSQRLSEVLGDHGEPRRADGRTVFRPAVLARLRLRFDEGQWFAAERDEHRLFYPLDPQPRLAGEPELGDADLSDRVPEGLFAPLPANLDEASELEALRREVVEEILRGETEVAFRHRQLKLTSRAGEDLAGFKRRVGAAIQEAVDDGMNRLFAKVDTQRRRLDDRRAKLEADLDRSRGKAKDQLANEVVSAGETLFGLFFGRKRSVSSVVRRRAQTRSANERVSDVQEQLERLQDDIDAFTRDVAEQAERLKADELAKLDDIEEVAVGLEKADISLDAFTVVWIPVSRPV